jgi:hypothetical protein
MPVNRKVQKKVWFDIEIGSSYEELSLADIQTVLEETLKVQKEQGKLVDWTIYACGDYDGGGELHLVATRWEKDNEVKDRIAREELFEKDQIKEQERQRKLQEKIDKNRKKKEADPEYQQLIELQKRINEKYKDT